MQTRAKRLVAVVCRRLRLLTSPSSHYTPSRICSSTNAHLRPDTPHRRYASGCTQGPRWPESSSTQLPPTPRAAWAALRPWPTLTGSVLPSAKHREDSPGAQPTRSALSRRGREPTGPILLRVTTAPCFLRQVAKSSMHF